MLSPLIVEPPGLEHWTPAGTLGLLGLLGLGLLGLFGLFGLLRLLGLLGLLGPLGLPWPSSPLATGPLPRQRLKGKAVKSSTRTSYFQYSWKQGIS